MANTFTLHSDHSATTLLLLLLTAVAYVIRNALYRLYFHPLAKYPGPKLRALSRIPRWYTTFIGDEAKVGSTLHEQYGSVVRIDVNTLSFNTPEAWKDIYGHKAGQSRIIREPDFYKVDHAGVLDSVVRADGPIHSRMRRTIAHAFSASALMGQEPLMTKYFSIVDIMSYYNFTTFDIIGDLTFGEPFGALATGSNHEWVSAIFAGIKIQRYMRIGKTFPIMEYPLRLFRNLPVVRQAMMKHKLFTIEKTRQRLDTPMDRHDFMWYITKNNDDKDQGIGDDEICGNAGVLIIAGSETTATLLSGATYLLLKNPKWLQLVKEETRNHFKSRDNINIAECQSQLPIMTAVLEESFRLYPPVAATLPRRTLTEVVVDGNVIPAQTTIGVHQTATYSSRSNFESPGIFAPGRWMKDSAEYPTDQKDALQPFSVGPQACIGRNLAYAEMSSILVRILYDFDLELCADSENWLDQKMWTLWDKPPLNVKLMPRVGAN